MGLLPLAQTIQRLENGFMLIFFMNCKKNQCRNSGFWLEFLLFNVFELSTKLTIRRTNVRLQARQNVFLPHFASFREFCI